MKVVTKQEYGYIYKQAKEMTYQTPFFEMGKCPKCHKATTLIMLIDDDEGLMERQRPKGVKVWPHDCTAIALYLCTHCGEMTAVWNQG